MKGKKKSVKTLSNQIEIDFSPKKRHNSEPEKAKIINLHGAVKKRLVAQALRTTKSF